MEMEMEMGRHNTMFSKCILNTVKANITKSALTGGPDI